LTAERGGRVERASPVRDFHAGQVILGAAKRSKPAIAVIGSRGLDGVLALGSVSRRVVHGAPCSVLLVPQGRRDLRSSRGSSR